MKWPVTTSARCPADQQHCVLGWDHCYSAKRVLHNSFTVFHITIQHHFVSGFSSGACNNVSCVRIMVLQAAPSATIQTTFKQDFCLHPSNITSSLTSPGEISWLAAATHRWRWGWLPGCPRAWWRWTCSAPWTGCSSGPCTHSTLELQTKVSEDYAKISQSRRRPLLGPSPGWKRLK